MERERERDGEREREREREMGGGGGQRVSSVQMLRSLLPTAKIITVINLLTTCTTTSAQWRPAEKRGREKRPVSEIKIGYLTNAQLPLPLSRSLWEEKLGFIAQHMTKN